MPSRISFFNKTLFRKNLTRFWPIWGTLSLGGSLLPLFGLVQMLRSPDVIITPLEMKDAYLEMLTYGVPILSLMYAILCAEAVWSYLYNNRSVSLMHTLPIRREGLFFTNFVSGMVMMLIPYVVAGTLMILLSVFFGFFEPTGVLTIILGVIGESFFYFSTATMVAFFVGNVLTLPGVYFALHFLVVVMDWIISSFARKFLFGFYSSYSGALEYLSPTVYLMEKMGVNRVYEEIVEPRPGGGEIYRNILKEVALENGWLIAVYVLAGVVCLAIAWALYRVRRSESAGDVVAVRWMKPVYRYGVSILMALLGGLMLYELFWQSVRSSAYYEVIPMAVCMTISGIVGYCFASMSLDKTFHIFRRSWKGFLVVAACCVAICTVLHLDVFGVVERIPETDEIEMLEIRVANNSYTFYPGEEDMLLEQVRDLHAAIAAEAEYFMEMEDEGYIAYYENDEPGWTNEYLSICYNLKNGKTVERRYDLYLTKERMGQSGTVDHQIDQLVNSAAMKLKRLHLNDPSYVLESGYLYLNSRNRGYDLNSREASAVIDAIGRDLMAGTWGTHQWFRWDSGDECALDLSLDFSYKTGEIDKDGDEIIHYDSIYITLYPEMTNTLRCLQELGLAQQEDFKTYRELYPEDYGDEYVEKYSELAYESAPIVIGGADGPTEVFVTGVVS